MRFVYHRTDLFITLLWILIYLAFLEFFGDWGPLFYLIHSPPILFVLPFITFILYRLLKKEISVVPLLLALGIYIHLNGILGRELTMRSIPAVDSKHTTPVRICSWNTAYFFKWGKQAGLETLLSQKCDFILLQEVWKSEESIKDITAVRDTYFPSFDFYNYGEFLIFTPKDSVITTAKSPSNAFFSIDATFKDKPIELTSVHLWNPITDMPTLLDGKMAIVPVKEARALQKMDFLAFLSTPLRKSTPSIIVGDFNTMQNGKIIREITNLKEKNYSFISTPIYKLKNTYSTRIPLIQIDFAYISSDYKDYATLKTYCRPVASDHCLLIIDVVL